MRGAPPASRPRTDAADPQPAWSADQGRDSDKLLRQPESHQDVAAQVSGLRARQVAREPTSTACPGSPCPPRAGRPRAPGTSHPDRRWYPDCWGLVGGHVEPGERPEETVVRECREEVGVEIADPTPFAMAFDDPTLEVHPFVVTRWAMLPAPGSPGSSAHLRGAVHVSALAPGDLPRWAGSTHYPMLARPSRRSRTGDDGAIIAACLGLSNGFVLAHGNEPPGLAQRCHTPATKSNACSRRSRLCARRSIRG